MRRGGSIKLANVFGIRIGVDTSWFIVLFLIIWLLSGYYGDALPNSGSILPFVLATVSALLFFLSIVLHELGHSLVAIRNKIPIAGIDLWMLGGVAKMTRDTDSPGVEFRVAIAGPIVTLLIAGLCGAIGAATAGWANFADAMRLKPEALANGGLAMLAYLTSINLLVFIFNLMPAFPLDGGRVARAIAWKITGNRSSATRFAARLGRALSYVLIGFGIVRIAFGDLLGGVWLVFLGFFISQAARGAEYQNAITSRIEGVTVADVMELEPVEIPFDITVHQALDQFFLRYRYPWFPVTDALGRYVGLLEKKQVDAVDERQSQVSRVADVMTDDHEGSLRVDESEKLETILGSEALYRLGALMAVDAAGHLRGIVTVDDVRRALRAGGMAV